MVLLYFKTAGDTMKDIIIEKVTVSDAEELLSIYAPYITETTFTFEYDVPSIEEFRQRIEKITSKYPYLKAVCNGKICGYAYLSSFKERAAYQFSAETSMYIRKDMRSSGIGSVLYDALEDIAKKQGIINLNACIAYPNPPSEKFNAKKGYKKVAHFTKCGFKFGKWCDMIWMEKFIGEHTGTPAEFIPFSKLNI